jgi:predicted transcriptional regulator of viral defense system
MNYNKFRTELEDFPIFTLKDIRKLDEKVYHHRLIDWQKKGYIERIGNGVYKFSEVKLNENIFFYIANRLYEPSYISLETAFSHYNFIPETVYNITSVTSKKTASFKTNYAVFNYQKVKNNLMFGYRLNNNNNLTIKIAEPEKAILDYLYLHSEITSSSHIKEMRLNANQFNEEIDREKLNNYLLLFENKELNRRLNYLLNWIDNAEY